MGWTGICLLIVFCSLNGVLALKYKVCSPCTHHLDVEVRKAVNVVNEKFLSVGLDAGVLCENRAWKGFNVSSPLLLSLSKALSPAYLRFGGTSQDYVIFKNTNSGKNSLKGFHCANNTVLTEQDWIKLNKYSASVGWKLLFGLNALLRKGSHWNPSNTIQLLKKNDKLGYHPGWELGNELNAHKQLEGRQLGKDFVKLRTLLNSFRCSNSSLLVGPDVTSKKFEYFLETFLHEAKEVIDAITFHHYYFSARTATLEDFLNVDNFDSFKTVIADVFKVVKKAKSHSKVWLGETSIAWGGGAAGFSDRYVSGFLWLDKLGLSAVHGIDVVVKQSIYHGNYSLLTNQLYPLPNYWLSLLYKWLVGRKVLNVKITPTDRKLRVYAHCVQKGRLYKSSNGVTVYAINLHNSTVEIAVPALSASSLHQYLVTPRSKMGLQSMNVTLNGQELKMNNTELPHIFPEIKPPNSSLVLPPFTYGFYVFPDAVVPACFDRK